MANTDRVDKNLFRDTHYLGKPADDVDKIITRRISILEQYPEFFDTNADLIEVGSGSGATITRLAHRFKSATGIDIFDYTDEYKKQQLKNGDTISTFKKLDLEQEPLPGTYDRLISFEVIEHLRSDDSISKYNDLLRPGGLAAITVPNKWWIFETHGAKLPLLPWNRVPFFSWLPTPIHERYANARIYTRNRIERLFEKHGFTIIDTVYVTAPMDVLKEGRLKDFVTKNIFKSDTTSSPFLATSVFVLAKKK
ncbi:MAG TPA: methyltransferase domain-containing protein [Flavitalea sp.]|nr:methyltransferase domain-containing protein [Flavitalea sp.]